MSIERQLLQDNLRKLLAEQCGRERMRRHVEAGACDVELWQQLCELGLVEALPLGDALTVHAELGRSLAPVPYLQVSAACDLLARLGIAAPPSCSLLVRDMTWSTEPGDALLPFADAVDAFIVTEQQGDQIAVGMRAVDAIDRVETLDSSWPLWRVKDTSTEIIGRADLAEFQRAFDGTCVHSRNLLCAEMLGSAEACFDACLDHLQTREQFGQPLGTFQALQHAAADMAIRLEGMRAYQHAWLTEEPDARMSMMAKAHASDGFCFIARKCLQLYGGMGFTWENDVHLRLRHAQRCGSLFGTPSALRREHITMTRPL